MYVMLCMPMVPVWFFFESVFVGCTNLMLLYFQFVGAPGAVNIHYFVWKFFGAIYKFPFIHSIIYNGLMSLRVLTAGQSE